MRVGGTLKEAGKIGFQFFSPDVTGNNSRSYLTQVHKLLHVPF